jgi:hypothetical protein
VLGEETDITQRVLDDLHVFAEEHVGAQHMNNHQDENDEAK